MPTVPGRQAASKRTWQRRSAARPAEIRAAALELFAKRGYGGTTIEDIAHAADVTVGTIYRYFTDKSQLLASLIRIASEEPLLPVAAQPTSLSSSNPADEVRATLAEAWSASRRPPHTHILRILVAESENAPELVAQYRQSALEPAAALLARQLQAAGAPGDCALAARAALGQLLGASLLAGAPVAEPLVPQLDPIGVTIESIARGALGLEMPRPATGPIRPQPEPKPEPIPTRPAPAARRYSGPDSW